MNARSLIPNWAETFHDLQSASTLDELWGVLLDWHGIRGSTVWEERYLLFMRFHRHESAYAEVTGALLCTDYRWRNASHHLIDRLGGSGILDEDQLDALADWFSGEMFEVTIDTTDTPTKDGDATVQRPIWPPLRRWAARHQVERHPDRWRDVIDASAALPSRDAAATVAGVMDAAEHIPTDDRPALASIGLSHGSGAVRLAALPALASTVGTNAAIAAARRDPSAKVRAWNPSGTSGSDPSDQDPTAPSAVDTRSAARGQPPLFD